MKTKIFDRVGGIVVPSFALPAICAAIGFLAGCASEPSSVVVSSPPPPPPTVASATVYSAPAVSQPVAVATVPTPVGGSSIIVMQAPPALQQEVPTARPSSSHAWVSGYWMWRNNQ